MNSQLPKISEHQIRNDILDLMRYNGWMCWTNNSGGMTNEYTNKKGITKKRFTRFGGLPGASDIFAVKNGLFYALEVKTPERRNEATRFQLEFIEQVKAHGGVAEIVTSTKECAAILGIKGLL